MGIVKLTANVPTRVKMKYLDIRKGDYEPYVAINGATVTDDGRTEEGMIIIPGSAPDALNEMKRAGIITVVPQTMPQNKGDKENVKFAMSDVILTAVLPAGEKYASLRAQVTHGGNGTPPVAQAQPQHVETGAPPAAAPQAPALTPAPFYSNPLYASLVTFVAGEILNRWPADVKVSPESFAAMVNTLYISETRK